MPAFATPEPITATVSTAGAKVRIVATERTDTTVLVEAVNSANKSDVKVAEGVKVEFAAGRLSVKTTKSGAKAGSVAITIELPVGSGLVLKTAWTDVRAEGLLGDCVLEMGSGLVELDRIAGLSGSLVAGGLEVGHVAGAVELQGGAAGVRIGEVEGVVRYVGSTGKVWIGHAQSDVDLNGASGSFDIDRADGSVIAKAANCPIRVGRMTRGQADLMNASGGIEVGIGAGVAASVDANSTKGVVRNSHDVPGDTVRVYARTRLDDIVIHAAA